MVYQSLKFLEYLSLEHGVGYSCIKGTEKEANNMDANCTDHIVIFMVKQLEEFGN